MTDEQKTVSLEEEYLAGWKRAQADYANLKKDMEREKAEFAKFANVRLLSDLLPAFDQFDVALAHLPDLSTLEEKDRDRIQQWITGIVAVRSVWDAALRSCGAEPVPTTGAFDPSVHEAVGQEPSDAIPEGEIIRAVETGWTLHGRLIRSARVIISKGKS